jgi:hypothetical protein
MALMPYPFALPFIIAVYPVNRVSMINLPGFALAAILVNAWLKARIFTAARQHQSRNYQNQIDYCLHVLLSKINFSYRRFAD